MNVKFCLTLNIFLIYLYFSFNMPKAGWLDMNIFILIGNFLSSTLVLGWLFWRKNYQFHLKRETKLPEYTSRSNCWLVPLHYLNAVKFLGWLKKFWPAQNILGPVKGQGMSPLYHATGQLSTPLYKLPLVFYRWTQKSLRHARESKFFQVLPAWFGPKLKNI